MKSKLYIYPYVRPMLHDQTEGFENSIPMTQVGIAKHFEVTSDPDEADYYFMGQIADREAWMLHPNRFPYYKNQAMARHVVDLEGDWRDFDHPDWLSEAVIVTGHVRLNSTHKFKRRFARPVISPMLLRLANNKEPSQPWTARGFWFQGQMDFSRQYREKIRQAFEMAKVPGEFQINPGWALYLDPEHELVKSYQQRAQRWSYALCPMGEGPTCRLYEMALMDRIPILIADYQPFGPDLLMRWSIESSVELLAGHMRMLMINRYEQELLDRVRRYAVELRSYLADPTAYLLKYLTT